MDWMDELFDESYHYDHAKLDKLSGVLDEIAKDIRNDKYYSIDKHPKREIVEKGLAEVFGFKKMNITSSIGGDPTVVNAFTGSGYIDSQSEDKDGHIKNTGKIDKMTVYITRALIADNTYPQTGRELMAVILHELGHFFVMSESKIKTRKALAISAILSLNFQLYSFIKKQSDQDEVKRFADEEDDYVAQRRAFDDAVAKKGADIVDDIVGDKHDLKEPAEKSSDTISAIKSKIAAFGNSVYSAMLDVVKRVFGEDAISLAVDNPIIKHVYGRKPITNTDHQQQVERESDEFAASFGYGPEVISALMKMHHDPRLKVLSQNIKSEIKADNMVSGEYWQWIDSYYEQYDHDSNKNRAKSVLDNLKKYADEPGLSKNDKANIQKQIKQMEKAIRVMEGFSKSEIKNLVEAGKDAVEKAKKHRT